MKMFSFADNKSNSLEKPVKDTVGGPCLLVFLQPQLILSKSLQWPIKSFSLGQSIYHDAGFGDWTGFYDWLRDSDGNALGVRYTPFEDTEFLVGEVQQLDYVKVLPPCHIEIYFSAKREFDPGLSRDQDFEYQAIFHSDDGAYALGFGMGSLTEGNHRSIEKLNVPWVTTRVLEQG